MGENLEERQLLISILSSQIIKNNNDNKPLRGHIKNYQYSISNQYSFSVEFVSTSDMTLVAMNNDSSNSEVYPLKEKYHLTYHTSTGIDIPVNLERKICVIDNDEIEEFYNIGDINMYNTRIKPEYKSIIVNDFTNHNNSYTHNSFDKDRFYRYIDKNEGKITIPFRFYLDGEKLPKEIESGFYLTKLDEKYMANHPLEYRQYSIDDPNEKIINYEDCIDYSKKCVDECRYYFNALKEAYENAKIIKSTRKTI